MALKMRENYCAYILFHRANRANFHNYMYVEFMPMCNQTKD